MKENVFAEKLWYTLFPNCFSFQCMVVSQQEEFDRTIFKKADTVTGLYLVYMVWPVGLAADLQENRHGGKLVLAYKLDMAFCMQLKLNVVFRLHLSCLDMGIMLFVWLYMAKTKTKTNQSWLSSFVQILVEKQSAVNSPPHPWTS